MKNLKHSKDDISMAIDAVGVLTSHNIEISIKLAALDGLPPHHIEIRPRCSLDRCAFWYGVYAKPMVEIEVCGLRFPMRVIGVRRDAKFAHLYAADFLSGLAVAIDSIPPEKKVTDDRPDGSSSAGGKKKKRRS
jgi:hypothetical protein